MYSNFAAALRWFLALGSVQIRPENAKNLTFLTIYDRSKYSIFKNEEKQSRRNEITNRKSVIKSADFISQEERKISSNHLVSKY